MVVVVAPLVADRAHAAMEGDGGHQHVVRVEQLQGATRFGLETAVGEYGLIEGEVAIHVDSVLRSSKALHFWIEIVLLLEITPRVRHGHDEDLARIQKKRVVWMKTSDTVLSHAIRHIPVLYV